MEGPGHPRCSTMHRGQGSGVGRGLARGADRELFGRRHLEIADRPGAGFGKKGETIAGFAAEAHAEGHATAIPTQIVALRHPTADLVRAPGPDHGLALQAEMYDVPVGIAHALRL